MAVIIPLPRRDREPFALMKGICQHCVKPVPSTRYFQLSFTGGVYHPECAQEILNDPKSTFEDIESFEESYP